MKPKYYVLHQCGDWDTAKSLQEATEKAKSWPDYDIRDNEEILVCKVVKRVVHKKRQVEVSDET